MLVKDIMTTRPTCCTPETRLDVVAKMMLNHDCGAIPVCDGDRLAGMITDRDIVVRAVAKGMTPVAIAAADIMSRPVYTVREDETAEAALATMQKRRVRRLAVVDDMGALAGILAEADIARNLPDLEVAAALRNIVRKEAATASA